MSEPNDGETILYLCQYLKLYESLLPKKMKKSEQQWVPKVCWEYHNSMASEKTAQLLQHFNEALGICFEELAMLLAYPLILFAK